MASPPNFTSTTAVARNGNVRVDMAAPPVAWGVGFIYTLSPDVADALADQLRAAAKIARIEAVAAQEKQTAEKSAAQSQQRG